MDIKKIEKQRAKELRKKEKELEKARKLLAKSDKKINKEVLPSDPTKSKGIKAFFRKWGVRLGLVGIMSAGVYGGYNAHANNDTIDNAKKIEDNNDRVKNDKDELTEFMNEVGVKLPEEETTSSYDKEVETEQETINVAEKELTLRDDLTAQTVLVDELYQAPGAVSLDDVADKAARDEVGLEENETTPIESIETTNKNETVTFDENDIINETTQPDKEEQETTQVVIDTKDEEKTNIIVGVNDGANVTVEDGTIKIEDATGTITIENEETTKQPETIIFENRDPFAEDEVVAHSEEETKAYEDDELDR